MGGTAATTIATTATTATITTADNAVASAATTVVVRSRQQHAGHSAAFVVQIVVVHLCGAQCQEFCRAGEFPVFPCLFLGTAG